MAAKKGTRRQPRRGSKKEEPVEEPVVEEPVEESESEAEVVEEEPMEEDVEEEEEESSEEESGDEDMEEESEEEEEEDDDEDAPAGPVTIKPVASATGEQWTFDLRNLLALNSHQVETAKLYSKKGRSAEEITIPGEKLQVTIDEAHLLEKAADGCTQLIHALWQLPTERNDAGPLVLLPSYSETLLPRQLVSFLRSYRSALAYFHCIF
jgi:hypothetical protein